MHRDEWKQWANRKDFYILVLVFLAIPFVSHAGGLGIAAVLAVSGFAALAGALPFQILGNLRRIPLALWLLFLLLCWGGLSSVWSPYSSGHILPNSVKILIGVPVYLLCACIIKTCAADDKQRKILVGLLFFGSIASAVALLADQLSGYAINYALSPLSPGQDPNLRVGDIIQNIGHGTTVTALLVAPVSVLLWQRGQIGKMTALAFIGVAMAAAITTGTSASVLAILTALALMAVALWRPRMAVKFSFLFAIFTLLWAPVLAYLATTISAETKASLPFSWEERIENWGYLYHKIIEHPIFGHGFDAVRTFNDTHTIRGFEGRAFVSLHPHNAGLHMWVELGIVGAVLASAALYLAMQNVVRLEGVMSRLNRPQMMAISGVVGAATIISNLSYGLWQDWWWASVIFAGSQIFLLRD